MFTWICPKCGKEVPPSYSDCPNCAAAQQPTPDLPAAPARPSPPPTPVFVTRGPAPRARSSVPAWALALLTAAVLVIIALTAVVVLRSRRVAEAPAAPAEALQNPPLVPAAQVNPALKMIELTGFRLLEDKQQKPQLQFVVVNHGGADIGELKAKAILRSAVAKPEEPPVATFSFSATLGPYESKDLKVPLETRLRAYELPDWQMLRAEIVGQ